jgi:hypothetical protein
VECVAALSVARAAQAADRSLPIMGALECQAVSVALVPACMARARVAQAAHSSPAMAAEAWEVISVTAA